MVQTPYCNIMAGKEHVISDAYREFHHIRRKLPTTPQDFRTLQLRTASCSPETTDKHWTKKFVLRRCKQMSTSTSRWAAFLEAGRTSLHSVKMMNVLGCQERICKTEFTAFALTDGLQESSWFYSVSKRRLPS